MQVEKRDILHAMPKTNMTESDILGNGLFINLTGVRPKDEKEYTLRQIRTHLGNILR